MEAALRAVVDRRGLKPKDVFQPLRVALAGRPVSPGIFETVAVLGRAEVLDRVDRALAAGRTGVRPEGRRRLTRPALKFLTVLCRYVSQSGRAPGEADLPGYGQ